MFSDHEGELEEALPGVRILRASREPCIVCGHPTGDCGDGSHLRRIVGDNVEQRSSENVKVLVLEDVYGEAQITPFTRARVLLAAAGTYIDAERARELGIV